METIQRNPEIEDGHFDFIRKFLEDLPSTIKKVDAQSIHTERPQRCRALLFSSNSQNIALIGRERSESSYAVFPGGGVEPEDIDAVATVRRELKEELSIDPDDITIYEETALEIEPGVWAFLAIANHSDVELRLGDGPELKRNGISDRGSYNPIWLPLKDFSTINLMPYEVRDAVAQAILSIDTPYDKLSQDISE